MTAALAAETFAPHVGKAVSLSNGHRLTLVAVEIPKLRTDAPAQKGFTLILRGPASPVAPEGLHTLTLENGPTFDLYVIPVHTPSPDHQDYQVVVN